MSKTVPVHARSSRPSSPVSPASALLPASRHLTASPVALPVHDVSTTRATTQKLHRRGLTGRRSGREAVICQLRFRHDRLSVPRGDGLLPASSIRQEQRRAPASHHLIALSERGGPVVPRTTRVGSRTISLASVRP